MPSKVSRSQSSINHLEEQEIHIKDVQLTNLYDALISIMDEDL